jgi:hypothetical protein
MPYCSIRIETAEAYAAAAVLERGEQRHRAHRNTTTRLHVTTEQR